MIRMEIVGNVGQNAKQKEINGRYVTSFSVAHNVKLKDKEGNDIEKTVWVSCSVFRSKSSDLYKYLSKGTKVYVSGIPDVRVYQDQSGNYNAGLNLTVKDLEFVSGSKKEESSETEEYEENEQKQKPQTEQKVEQVASGDNDELPF
jgi:single-strand DNA-binding protein